MAMPKSRKSIAVITVSTVLGAALLVVVLQSRWRATNAIDFVNMKNKQRPPSIISGSTAKPSELDEEPVLAGSQYWKKAVNVVNNLIKDRLKSDPHADPDSILAAWLAQVSNRYPQDPDRPASDPETIIGTERKTPSDSELASDQKAKWTTTPPPIAPTTINSRRDLPFLTRGSVEIRPERLPPPAHSSDIYISLLTAPKYHDTRISLQYLTWIQTIDPKQVQFGLILCHTQAYLVMTHPLPISL